MMHTMFALGALFGICVGIALTLLSIRVRERGGDPWERARSDALATGRGYIVFERRGKRRVTARRLHPASVFETGGGVPGERA